MCGTSVAADAYNSLGSGTASDPYILCTPSQLVSLSAAPSDALKYSYRMGSSINLAGTAFAPIGSLLTPYHGTFDGAGYTVTGVQLGLPNQDNVGFFGAVAGPAAEVRNLNIDSATVAGESSVGILSGSLDRGRVINCFTSGTVTGQWDVGGVVGAGSYAPLISTSRSTATVTGSGGRVGGLVGSVQEGGLIANSYASGQVTGGDQWIGGLVGTTHASTIVNSYSTGDVTSAATDADMLGGLVGASCSFIQLSFATGSVTAPNSQTQNIDPLVGYWPCGSAESEHDYQLAGTTCQSAHGKCPAVMGTNPIVVPSLSALQDASSLPLSAWDFGNVWTRSNSGFPTIVAPVVFDANTWDGCAAHSSDPHAAGGVGTPEQPLLLSRQTQFAKLGVDAPCGHGTGGFTAVQYISQMADIDLTGATLAPVGTDSVNFYGVYDGHGHKLENFTIQSSAHEVGLIGVAGFSLITRVAAVNGTVTATGNGSSAGLIIGNMFGTISDSYATGTIRGTANVGGVSGGTHTIVDVYSAATVVATGGAGGIDGTGGPDEGISNCFAASDVTGSSADPVVVFAVGGTTTDCCYDSSKTCSLCDRSGAMAISNPQYFFAPSNPSDSPFTAWDFDNVWTAAPNGYPDLR